MREKVTKFFLRLSLITLTFLLSPFHVKAEDILTTTQLSGDVVPVGPSISTIARLLPGLALLLIPITVIVVVIVVVARQAKKTPKKASPKKK